MSPAPAESAQKRSLALLLYQEDEFLTAFRDQEQEEAEKQG